MAIHAWAGKGESLGLYFSHCQPNHGVIDIVVRTFDWSTGILCMWLFAQFPHTGTAYTINYRSIRLYSMKKHLQLNDVCWLNDDYNILVSDSLVVWRWYVGTIVSFLANIYLSRVLGLRLVERIAVFFL